MLSSHFLTDKSLTLESRFGGWALRRRAFAEPGVEPHYSPDRPARIEHIALDLVIDPVARTLVGSARVRFVPVAGAHPRYQLDLDEVTVLAVEDGAGGALSFRHADGVLSFPAVAEVVVRWEGSPRRGLYFVGPDESAPDRPAEAWTQCQDEDAHFIFPCFDHPSVKHPWSIRVTAPAGYEVVSNGRFVGTEGLTRVWEQAEPMPAYLFSAVVLAAEVYEDLGAGVPLRYVVPRGVAESTARRVFGRTPAMIAFLSERFGAYPWPRYDQVVVHDFIFGGMENIAATTLTDAVLTDERAGLDFDSDDLIVHEMAHQWFGDLLTCQDWSQGWLNEGWATWTEHLWSAHAHGADEAAYTLFGHLTDYLTEEGGRYRRPIVSYLFREPIDVFDRHLYEKGALVLQTLRTTLGDEAFWAGVRLYLERHRHGTVHTRHFQRALEDATGRCLDRFFQQWVYGAGHPTLEVAVAHEGGLLSVTVKQTQEGEGVAPAFHVPLVLRYGDVTLALPVDARERTWALPCAEAPAFVGIDSGLAILADLTVSAPRSMLLAMLREDSGIVGRIRAARALVKEGSPEAIRAVAGALASDPFWGVRAELAELLGERGGEVERAALIAALGDKEPKVRRRVVTALGRVRHPDVVAALVGMPTDASVQVEAEVVKSLGRLRAAEALDRAKANLDRGSWSDVLRARAYEALGALRTIDVLPLLLAGTAPSIPVRGRAAASAGLVALGNEVDAARTAAVERLLELAEDPKFRVQVAAINGLGTLRDARAIPVLERVHAAAGDGRCRRLAFEALASVREGRTTAEGLAGLRGEVERLVDENRKLRDRVGRIEAKA